MFISRRSTSGPKACDGCAFAASSILAMHVGCQLQVPSVVEFACLKNRTTRASCVAATFEVTLRRQVCLVAVVSVGGHVDHVIWTEIVNHEGTGADWVEVGFCTLWRFGTKAIRKLCCLNDRGLAAHERTVWVWLGLVKVTLTVRSSDASTLSRRQRTQLRTAAFWVHAILGGELHVRGGDGRAIGPQQA